MSVKASPEIIREMKRNLEKTMRDLEEISGIIRNALRATPEWEDEKSLEFKRVMRQIGDLTVKPVDTLKSAKPKLETLAEALDEYSRVKF